MVPIRHDLPRSSALLAPWARQEERADPAARDNAREVTVIRMARLRSVSPVIQKRPLHARPRVSHL